MDLGVMDVNDVVGLKRIKRERRSNKSQTLPLCHKKHERLLSHGIIHAFSHLRLLCRLERSCFSLVSSLFSFDR